ncbi:hypothetical protein Lumi_091 [Xylophilus phage Lumi]|nr:hypothetical protein Lumi_091 [Xylophilus phage Lumi]
MITTLVTVQVVGIIILLSVIIVCDWPRQ